MTQNRDAPAYQEYAASMMSKMQYRVMTLSERGLLYSMRQECWVNGCVPSDINNLSKVLGFDPFEVGKSLKNVMHFFKIQGNFIICPELDDYKTYLAKRKEKLSSSGKKGAESTNKKRKESVGHPVGHPDSTPVGNPDGLLVQYSTAKSSTDFQGEYIPSTWLIDEQPNEWDMEINDEQ
jgi:hypothetical protein